MRLPDDDELYMVDQTYLGPPGRYIAAMRHKAIFAALIIGPISMVLLRRVGMPLTLLTVALWFLATIWAAMKVADHLSAETSAADLFKTMKHELTAPRADRRIHHATTAAAYSRATRVRGGWAKAVRRSSAQAGANTEPSATGQPEPKHHQPDQGVTS
jgi:hypothetical protein